MFWICLWLALQRRGVLLQFWLSRKLLRSTVGKKECFWLVESLCEILFWRNSITDFVVALPTASILITASQWRVWRGATLSLWRKGHYWISSPVYFRKSPVYSVFLTSVFPVYSVSFCPSFPSQSPLQTKDLNWYSQMSVDILGTSCDQCRSTVQ